MHVHIDAVGGMAGDMFLGAMLDVWPEQFDGVYGSIRQAGLPDAVSVGVTPFRDHALAGQRFVVEAVDAAPQPAGRYRDIRERLASTDLSPPVRDRTLAVLSLLAEAEGAVHGIAAEDVTFHELAGWDSIADIVGAAYLLEALSIASWSVSPLPVGGGRIKTAHGPLPVPAPAAAELLKGFDLIDDGIMGERVTPTGATILRHLAPSKSCAAGPLRLRTAGTGFGSRRLEGISNVVRLLVYQTREGGVAQRETVAVVSFEIDDQTPEDLAVGLDKLRARDGVLDVVQSPVLGKKGRVMASIRLLCRPYALNDVIDMCFTETTTIGVRWRVENRAVLTRQVAGGGIKLVERPRGRTAKMDIDAVRDVEGGAMVRREKRHQAESRALSEHPDD